MLSTLKKLATELKTAIISLIHKIWRGRLFFVQSGENSNFMKVNEKPGRIPADTFIKSKLSWSNLINYYLG